MLVAIVDDDPHVLGSLEDFFESYGIGTTAHSSADRFFASGDLGRVQCILTDLKMPGTNGLDLLARVVAQGGPPVCVMTSFVDSHTEAVVHAVGAAGFLRKPIKTSELLDFVLGLQSK